MNSIKENPFQVAAALGVSPCDKCAVERLRNPSRDLILSIRISKHASKTSGWGRYSADLIYDYVDLSICLETNPRGVREVQLSVQSQVQAYAGMSI